MVLIWPVSASGIPVPTPEYEAYRKHFPNLAFSPFFELTAYNYFQTLYYLLSGEVTRDILEELALLPDHIWQSLKTTTIASLPVYFNLYLSPGQDSGLFAQKNFWPVYFILHQIVMALTIYQAFHGILEEQVHFDLPGDISTDSLLLNSMLHLYFDSFDNLLIHLRPWSVPVFLNASASPVTHSLVRLHRQIKAMELEHCRIRPAQHRAGHWYLEFICSDGESLHYSGELELYSECSPVFSALTTGSTETCVVSRLQPDILDCLTAALQQGSNPLHSPHACTLSRQQAIARDDIVIHTLARPDPPVHGNFLISRSEQWYLLTGQYPQFNTSEDILRQFPGQGSLLPVFSASWEKLLSPIPEIAHQLTRSLALHAVNNAHLRFLHHHFASPLPVQDSVAPPPSPVSSTNHLATPAQQLATLPEIRLVPAITVDNLATGQSQKLNTLILANTLKMKLARQERRGSFSVRDSLPVISPLGRRVSLPLPGETGSRRGSLSFRDAASLMMNLQKATLKPGRFVNEPGKILAHPKQGMVEEHFNIIRDISRLSMQAIFFRMVNPENKDLIPLLLPSKDLIIKPKSADWNWGCGFLPEEPRYSKLAAVPEKIDQARTEILRLYQTHPERVCGQQLTLSTERMEKLLKKATTIISRTFLKVEALFEQHGISTHQIAEYHPDTDQWSIWNADGTSYNVIAHPEHGPYIADYDLLMTAVPMSHFYLLPVTEGQVITEHFVVVNNEGAEELLERTRQKITGEALSAFEPGSTCSTDTDGKTILTRTSLHTPKRYVQNQHFKPLELGDADRLKQPGIAPWLVLNYVRPKLLSFAASLGIAGQELLPMLEKTTVDNYKGVRSKLLQGLLQTYRPYHNTPLQRDTLMHIQPEYLPMVWQHRYPDSGPVYPQKPRQYRITSQELQAVYHARSFLLLLQDLDSYLAGMDKILGNLSPRMHQLVKQMNIGIDRGKGLAMVHHGCDSANPFSKPGDVCPATGLLPFQMGAEETTLITEPDAIEQMISTLKGHGFYVHTNPMWQFHGRVRSSRFEWALNCFEQKNDELYHPETDPLAKEIQLTRWPEIDPDLESKLGSCLMPYLYEPFIDGSETFLHHPVDDRPVQVRPLDHNPARDIGN